MDACTDVAVESVEAKEREGNRDRVSRMALNAIRGHPRPSEAIRGHPRPSEAIRGHPRPSEAISKQ